MQYFVYIVTVAVCTRTGPQEWQILRKFSQTVYASPSHRKMDMKGSYEQIVYPDLYFTIDNYEEAFSECVLRDSECLNVELTAYDRSGQAFGVCFLGTISYSTLKQFYDSSQTLQSSRHCSGQRNNRMTKSSYSCSSSIHNNNCPSIQFMRVIGPQAKGLAEIAIKPMESDYIIEQERQSLDLSKADYANSSDFIIKCCQPVCPSEIEIEYNSPDNYVLNDMNMKNKTKHSKVITQQPITESCKSASLLNFYESLLGINPKSDEPAHLQNTYINPIPTLYPSPWSVKSAGASVHTSPVRWSKRKVGSKCSTQPVSQQELSPTLNRRLQFKSTNAINLLNESKPSRVSEILNAFTGTVKKQSSDIHPTKSLQINVDNPTGKRSSMNNTKAVLFPMKKDDNESADRLKSLSIHEDACTDHLYENPFLSTDRGSSSFGQAWSWFKEKRRAISIALNASPTFITLPCQSVLVDLLEVRREPILNFSNR
ncbi:unnamed protein product [Heterobilharzia americana]|nr:unnamed protein product [Heterobilharzia americana]